MVAVVSPAAVVVSLVIVVGHKSLEDKFSHVEVVTSASPGGNVDSDTASPDKNVDEAYVFGVTTWHTAAVHVSYWAEVSGTDTDKVIGSHISDTPNCHAVGIGAIIRGTVHGEMRMAWDSSIVIPAVLVSDVLIMSVPVTDGGAVFPA